MSNQSAIAEKKSVALLSVFAAIALTGGKTTIGLLTGSLGILAEALHSGLDLVAAAITYFSVRVSDKPADKEHHFGHGKIENLSALVETVLLLITCAWIIYEAASRLLTGRVHIDVTAWSYAVVIASIIIDYGRSRALMKAARKYNSQALEADALHFSTDIWSSAVVLLGLVCASFGIYTADSVAALIVAAIVITVCYRLGKRAIDVLLDRAPQGMVTIVQNAADQIPEISSVGNIRVRTSGADVFIDIQITVDGSLPLSDAHAIADRFEAIVCSAIPRCFMQVHQEPTHSTSHDHNGESPDQRL
jgi:cation diffusion facilitator family transporter